MQDSITPEALEALNQKATQAAEDVRTKKTIDAMHAAFVAESAFARAVAALYRTGQLIHAQPSGDEVEAVARALAEFECANWDAQTLNETPTGETPEEMRQGYLEKATTAIARLDAHRGKQ